MINSLRRARAALLATESRIDSSAIGSALFALPSAGSTDRSKAFWYAATAGLLFLLTGLVSVLGVWSATEEAITEELREELVGIAYAAATVVDPALHETLTDPQQIDSPAYRQAVLPLRRLVSAIPQVRYIYTAVRDGDQARFILDASDPGDHDGDGVEDRAQLGEVYENPEPAIMVALGTATTPGYALCTGQTYTDKWGTFVTGYAPLYAADGRQIGVVGVDVDSRNYMGRVMKARTRALFGTLPAILVALIASVGVYVNRLRVLTTTRALADATIQAAAATRAKSEFLANMSHEIRTPLTAILGYAEMLEEDTERMNSPQQRAQTVDTIRQASEHLLTIVNDILDISKIEAGKMSIEQVDCHLDTLLAGVESLMRPHAHKKGLKLEVVRATALPQRFLTDPTRLRQVLMNLVGNAIKFTEQGIVTIRVSGQEQTQGALLKFDVEDTGVGLDEEQAKRLFSAFSQSDTSITRKHGGTGLGLVLSKRLARLLGGDVTITRSKLGEGSVFTATAMVIPIDQSSTSATQSQRFESKPPQAMASMTLSGRILLAEDGPDNQRLIALILRRAGAEVDVAANGHIALDMLTSARDERPYDLLITDIQMPEMDGYTLTARVRAMGARLPIIALTAHVMAEDRERCLTAGCNDFATKPIDKTALIAACARWLPCPSRPVAELETLALPLAP